MDLSNNTVEVKEFVCGEEGCGRRVKTKSGLEQHHKSKHEPITTYFICNVEKCGNWFESMQGVVRHQANAHGINEKWIECSVEGCNHKARLSGDLTKHKRDVHNIDTKFYPCTQLNCSYIAKQKGNLKQHYRNFHDLGDTECTCCTEPHFAHIPHPDPFTAGGLCKLCFREFFGANSTVELRWREYITTHFTTATPLLQDKALTSAGGCGRYRPDLMYNSPELTLILEIDEHQHSGTNYRCDERRITEIAHENNLTKLIVIRLNPDKWRGPDVSELDRFQQFVALMQHLVATPATDLPIEIHYLFFNPHGENICKNLPVFHHPPLNRR